MKKRRRLWVIVGVVALVFACLAVCVNSSAIIDYWCEQDDILAELDSGNNRTITISAASCWEVGQALYYEVKDHGTVVSHKSMFDVDEGGGGRHSYSLIYAENGTLVGVIDTATLKPHLIAIYDFKSGETYPRPGDDEVGYENPVIKRGRSLFQRLQQENPQLAMPDELK